MRGITDGPARCADDQAIAKEGNSHVLLALALIALLAPAAAQADAVNTANRQGSVGVNLSRNHSFYPALPWINALKMGEEWRETPAGGGACTQTNRAYTGSYDANGYPTEVGSGRVCVHTRFLEAATADPAWPRGEWVLRFTGEGSFEARGAGSGMTVSGQRGTFDVGGVGGAIYLGITSMNPANPVRNMRVYPPGGVCAANTSAPYDFEPWSYCSNARCEGGSCREAQPCGGARPHCIDLEEAAEQGGAIFHPLWLQRMRRYRTIRFMDWLHINHSGIVDFDDWTPESYWTYEYRDHQPRSGGRFNPGNVPPGVAAELCNVLNAECWFNVPHQATDAHIRELVRLLRDRIAPHLPVYLEYSNEVWNGIFAQHQWSIEAADALPDSVFDGTGCFGSGATECSDSFVGMRTFQMCQMAQAAFDEVGQGERLVCVLSRQASDTGKLARSLDCPRWLQAPGGNCYAQSDIDAVAIAPYFGDPTDCSQAGSVSELMTRMESDIDLEYALGSGLRSFLRNNFATLAARGLDWPLLAYEGGSSQSSTSSPICVQAATDPRIRDVYMQALDAWKDHRDVNGDDIRQYLQFDSLSPYERNLFGARGSWWGETSAWPKEAGMLDWQASNACWWPGCTLPSPGGGGGGGTACADGIDNDGDGHVDHPDDLGCTSPSDTSEHASFLPCDDGLDNDGDGDTDYPADTGCRESWGVGESPACADGVDNDRDGRIDGQDAGCRASWSPSESPACNDGGPNEGEGRVDGADPACLASWQASESTPACGLGFELVLVLPPLATLRRRRRRRCPV